MHKVRKKQLPILVPIPQKAKKESDVLSQEI
jgi:hypothetical protein